MKQNLAETISETAGGIWHGQGIDAIEYCRGQLAAFSYVSVTAAREVHVLRLRNSFERAIITPKLRYALSVISLMREAQELRGGYWFPTPLRAVPVGGHAILVGVTPTSELQRHFNGVSRAGYARVLPQQPGLGLPLQELDSWLGLIVPDSAAWAENQLEDANASMGPTIAPANVQFFTVLSKPSSFGITTYPIWAESPRDALSSMYGIVLSRTRVGRESFRYFLGRVKGGRLVAEGITPKDTMRMQFGIAALAGRPISVNAEIDENTSTFHIPVNLPRSERQLILALGVRNVRIKGKAYCVRGAVFASLVASRLRNLGCDLRPVDV